MGQGLLPAKQGFESALVEHDRAVFPDMLCSPVPAFGLNEQINRLGLTIVGCKGVCRLFQKRGEYRGRHNSLGLLPEELPEQRMKLKQFTLVVQSVGEETFPAEAEKVCFAAIGFLQSVYKSRPDFGKLGSQHQSVFFLFPKAGKNNAGKIIKEFLMIKFFALIPGADFPVLLL